MDFNAIVSILFRYIHVITACTAIGAAVFMRFILPPAIASLDESARLEILRRCRKGLKIIVHSAIMLLIISGSFNAWRNWPMYHDGVPLTHALFGMHVLLGLTVFALQLVILAGDPKPGHLKMLGWAVALVFAVGFVVKVIWLGR